MLSVDHGRAGPEQKRSSRFEDAAAKLGLIKNAAPIAKMRRPSWA